MIMYQQNSQKYDSKRINKELQKFSESDQNREVIIFDGPAYSTISRIEILDDKWSSRLKGKICLD